MLGSIEGGRDESLQWKEGELNGEREKRDLH